MRRAFKVEDGLHWSMSILAARSKSIMWKLSLVGITLSMCLAGFGCEPSDTVEGEDDVCGQAIQCKASNQCDVGDFCSNGCCAAWAQCVPGGGAVGQFCDEESGDYISAAEKCDLVGCECFVVDGVGQIPAAASAIPKVVLAPGGTRSIQVFVAQKSGPAVPGANVSLTLDADSLFSVISGVVTAKTDATGGTATLTATVDGLANAVTCTATLTNLGDAPTNGRVYVFDERSGEPLSGVSVVINDGSTDDIGGTSAADGIVTPRSDLGDVAKYTVSAFKDGYNYLSVVGLSGSQNSDITLPLAAQPSTANVAGFTGSGKNFFKTWEEKYNNGSSKDFSLGLVGSSFSVSSLLNFDLSFLIGDTLDADCDTTPTPAGCYPIEIKGLVDSVVALPGGLLGFLNGNNEIKGHFDVQGQAGRRYAWALGGELNLVDIGGVIGALAGGLGDSGDSTSGIDIGSLLTDLIPLFSNFGSAAQANLGLESKARSEWEGVVAKPYDERLTNGGFPKLDTEDTTARGDLVMTQGLTTFSAVKVPNLPLDPGLTTTGQMEGMIILTGVNAPGQGMVPLGLGLGIDCTADADTCLDRATATTQGDIDGKVNGTTVCKYNADPAKDACPASVSSVSTVTGGQIPDGYIGLYHAPAHNGLQDGEWLTIIGTLPISALVASEGEGVRGSFYVSRSEPVAGEDTTLSGITFEKLPKIADDVVNRTYVASDSPSGAQWVTVSNGSGPRWNIFFPGDGDTFVAPTPPGELADPFTTTAADKKVSVAHINFGLKSGKTLSSITNHNGDALNEIVNHVDKFSLWTDDLCTAACD
jgi:hypothetical protein